MGNPTHAQLVKRIRTLEKQVAANSAKAASKRSANAFRTFTDQSPNMIFINKGGRVVYVNKRCVEDMGYSREEFYAPDFDFMALIAPESVDLIRSNFKRHMMGEDVEPYEYGILNKQGERIESIITTKLITYDGEKAILGIVTDITARKRAEAELQYRLKFQHLITTVSSQFINLYPDQIDAEMNHTLQQIGEFADADRSYVIQFPEDQKSVSCTHEWCATEIEPLTERFQNVPVNAFPWAINKFLNAEMVLIPSVSDLPPEAIDDKQSFEQLGAQSLLAVPMAPGGRVIGFIGLTSIREEKMWTEDTSSLLKIVGQVFANALENKKTGRSYRKARNAGEPFLKPFRIRSSLARQKMGAAWTSMVPSHA
jgi:PAS domain S-box-containing protein